VCKPPDRGSGAGAETAAEEAARYRRLERDWQNDVGYALLDAPFTAPGSAAVFYRQWDRLIDVIATAPAGVVIEIGCGKGHFLESVRDRARLSGRTLVGLDVSRAVFSLPAAGLTGVQADGEVLPFRSGCAACVVYDGALHHLIDYRAALREAIRILAPGGRLVIFEPLSSPFSRLIHRVLDPFVFRKVVYESPIDIRYKHAFEPAVIRSVLRDQAMTWREDRSEFLAYPLTGCYAGSGFGRREGFMRGVMALEDRLAALPVIGRLLRWIAWRFTIVADKPAR
jgi:SAM-dependent methyltransferase